LKSFLKTRTAGDPDDEEIVFTDQSPATLSEQLSNMSAQTIRDWMDAMNYRLRKIRKDIAGGNHPDRNTQFENVAELR